MIRALACFGIVMSLLGCEKSRVTGTTLLEADHSAATLQAEADGALKPIVAVGNGVADDTSAIQALLDSSLTVKLPKPAVAFRVTTLRLRKNQDLTGPGKNVPCLQGSGKVPVLLLGDSQDKTIQSRNVTIRDLQIINTGAPTIGIYNSSNFYIGQSSLKGFETNTIEIRNSYRGVIENSFIGQSGTGWCINAMDNVNSLTIAKNVITGGDSGNGIDIGRSQAVRIRDNTMEVGAGYGVRVGGNPDRSVSGVCTSVEIVANYFEQIRHPISLGELWVVRSVTVASNYSANNANPSSHITDLGSFLTMGRVTAAQVHNNTASGSDKEPFITFIRDTDATVEAQASDSKVENNVFVHVTAPYTLQNFDAASAARLRAENQLLFTPGQL